jgi:hypothetical protein
MKIKKTEDYTEHQYSCPRCHSIVDAIIAYDILNKRLSLANACYCKHDFAEYCCAFCMDDFVKDGMKIDIEWRENENQKD